jgi:hypothetical protein
MSYRREKGGGGRVAEPVQVYLQPDEQDRLARLTDRLETSKSDVLRRGLEALERELADPAAHPVLRVIGIGASPSSAAGGARVEDPAREHDRVLADGEERSWAARPDGSDEADDS